MTSSELYELTRGLIIFYWLARSSDIFSVAVSTAISVAGVLDALGLCYYPRKLKNLKAFCSSFSTENLNRFFRTAWTMSIIFFLICKPVSFIMVCTMWVIFAPFTWSKKITCLKQFISIYFPQGCGQTVKSDLWVSGTQVGPGWPPIRSIGSSQRAILRPQLGKWPWAKFSHKRME